MSNHGLVLNLLGQLVVLFFLHINLESLTVAFEFLYLVEQTSSIAFELFIAGSEFVSRTLVNLMQGLDLSDFKLQMFFVVLGVFQDLSNFLDFYHIRLLLLFMLDLLGDVVIGVFYENLLFVSVLLCPKVEKLGFK